MCITTTSATSSSGQQNTKQEEQNSARIIFHSKDDHIVDDSNVVLSTLSGSSSRVNQYLATLVIMVMLVVLLPWLEYFGDIQKGNMASLASTFDSKKVEIVQNISRLDDDRNRNQNSAYLRQGKNDITLLERPNQMPPSSPTATQTYNPLAVQVPGGRPSTMSPYDIVQQHHTETKKELLAIQKQLGNHYISWDNAADNTDGLFYDTFKQEVVQFFQQHQSLVLIGDSTTRRIFGFLWCLLDDKFHNVTTPQEKRLACADLQNFLLGHCNVGNNDKCPKRANFTNPDYANFTMAFRPGYKLAKFQPYTMNAVRNRPSVLYIGLACLHSLWSLGRREIIAWIQYKDWPVLFGEQLAQIQDALLAEAAESNVQLPSSSSNVDESYSTSATRVLLGTPNCVCKDKMKAETEMIDMYLRDTPLSNLSLNDQQRIRENYNRQLDERWKLPENYTGVLPVIKPYRFHHTQEDFALFNDDGSRECSKIAMETLLSHFWKNSSKSPLLDAYVLDMRSATANACDFSMDGYHYGDIILMQKASLILKAAAAA